MLHTPSAQPREKSFEEVAAEIRGKPILVANRGIPARRILRTVRETLKAVPVLTATSVDKTSPSSSAARELMLLGDDPRAYLDIDLIIRKAKRRGVAAIHPGWGFASENESFPRKCEEAGIVFIGPTEEAMRLLGNKVEVRNLAQKLDVPVVPGSEGAVSVEEAREIAHEIGFPVMLKAEGGGGGRGIYVVESKDQLQSAFGRASAMAQASFGNPRLYVERYLKSVRHIEIQVIADRHGNVFAFDERDCTVQRNHQKLVEITPSPWPGMTQELRERLKEYSRRLVREVGYHSLATVEFLVEPDGTPYLIEVNTRLQVEHGITEARYGIDLVEEQIAVCFGSKLRFNEEKTRPYQYAMQVRVNCEDPRDGFAPNSGLITRYITSGGPGIRVDSCITVGYEFPSQYDSAAVLVIAYADSWEKTLSTMDRGLREYIISGVKTTIPFHLQLLAHPRFVEGEYDTRFIERAPELLCYTDDEPEEIRISRLVAEISALGYNPHVQLDDYRGPTDRRVGRFDPVLPKIGKGSENPYPRGDRAAVLDYVRDTDIVHFTDTTPRDIDQSNTGNRVRLAEDRVVGPYLDNCGFFSLENGGGAHFHVAMMASMTNPFSEYREWNDFAPKTMKQILIRSTNVLGYKPQPKNLMRKTGEMICEHFDVIRCFDFLNDIGNMRPFAEVILSDAARANIFEPAISLSMAEGFTIDHYLEVADAIVRMCAEASGRSPEEARRMIILGLKDMAGVCPPSFIGELVRRLRVRHPDLVLHYHRHMTDGLFVPAVAEAARAGCHIVDTAIGSAVRWYGQGDVLSTAAYMEKELGLKTRLNKDMIRTTDFVFKQIMPYFDRYTAPYFRGIDYSVTEHAMPGGATSSSQEGAMKQGYIHLLPHMLRFLAGTRQVVRYHDVTPGSQITWNTAFLAVTGAYKRGGERGVLQMLEILEAVTTLPEDELTPAQKEDRLSLYQDANDAFRSLLLGHFGRLPLGFPPAWVYKSAFGPDYKQALEGRTTNSPLDSLADADFLEEHKALRQLLDRQPTEEEFVMYLNHPGDALKTIQFQRQYGDPNNIPLDVWFEGLETGHELHFEDSRGKPHVMTILAVSRPDDRGMSVVRYVLDSEILSCQVKVGEAVSGAATSVEMADRDDEYHVASPSNGDLWVMHVSPGDFVKKGEELFNISIMKQEKSVYSPVEGMVRRVLKDADYQEDRKMVPVREGELLVELEPVPRTCPTCREPVLTDLCKFCSHCGQKLSPAEHRQAVSIEHHKGH